MNNQLQQLSSVSFDQLATAGVEIASLLIHELAHHYCPLTIGREDCATEAQYACESDLVP
jgi:hypothetical protein